MARLDREYPRFDDMLPLPFPPEEERAATELPSVVTSSVPAGPNALTVQLLAE